MKLKIHPLFVVTLCALLFFAKAGLVFSYIIAVVAHEYAHGKVARRLGYTVGNITLMPFGGVIDGGINFRRADNIIIALAGPVSNVLLAVCVVALWWFFPATYAISEPFCVANFTLAAINILPLYPLDGARVALSFARKKLRAIKVIKGATIASGIILFAVGVALIFVIKANFSMAIFGIFLVYNAFIKSEQESDEMIASACAFNKNYLAGIEKVVYYFDKQTPLVRLVSMLKAESLCEFVICHNNVALRTISEEQLNELCINNAMSCTLQEVLKL